MVGTLFFFFFFYTKPFHCPKWHPQFLHGLGAKYFVLWCRYHFRSPMSVPQIITVTSVVGPSSEAPGWWPQPIASACEWDKKHQNSCPLPHSCCRQVPDPSHPLSSPLVPSWHSWTSRCTLNQGNWEALITLTLIFHVIADFLGVEIKLIADLHERRCICINGSISNVLASWESCTEMERRKEACVSHLLFLHHQIAGSIFLIHKTGLLQPIENPPVEGSL